MDYSYFNSTLVRLKAQVRVIILFVASLFQFHIGTIKSMTIRILTRRLLNFNSTLVRLKAAPGAEPEIKAVISIPHWYD